MSDKPRKPSADAERKIAQQVRTITAAEQNLQILTGAPLDATTASPQAQYIGCDPPEKSPAREGAQPEGAETQAAILNALPTHVAFLGTDGTILAVNESWRRFATANGLHAPDFGVGQNYLSVCDRARGDSLQEAQAAAFGIRRVLHGEAKDFVSEYPCHSPTEQRWFQLIVTPVREDRLVGAVVMHANITERRRAEDPLRNNEQYVRSILDNLTAFVGLFTPDGIVLEANRPPLAGAGLRREDVVGKEFAETYWWNYAPDVQARIRDTFRRAAQGEIVSGDFQPRMANDVLMDVFIVFAPLCNALGKVVQVVASGFDITERKQTENALRASNEKFQLLAGNITDAFWIRSADMREVLYLSPAFEQIWGRTVESLRGNPGQWTDFVLPEDRERVMAAFSGLTTDTRSLDLEYRIVRPDGEIRWIRARAFQVRDAEDQLVRLTGIVTDITERQRAAEALQTSLEEFRTLAEAMPQMVWITRPDGGNIYFNQHWMNYTGLTLEESLGQGWNKPFHPDDQVRAWQAWRQAAATDGNYSFECRLRRADGEYRWWLIRGVPLRDLNGNILKWFGTCTDIHDLKLAELEVSLTNRALQTEIAERKRAEEAADAANRLKGEFLANMSHEIRTPLNGVLGMTELTLGTDLTAEQREYLEMVKSSGESLLSVVDDILDFSKIDAGKLTVDTIPLNLEKCLATALKLLATRAHGKGLELVCDIRSGVPPALVGDPSRLRQIITNLIGNAIKFTAHGEVLLTVEAETQTAENATLRFSVSDTGIGIPPEKQEAVFKPFVQADGSTTRKYGGTGLGLAIATSLVALMGGRIGLKSEVGKGSTFHFTMPFGVQQTPLRETLARDAQMMHVRDMPILVVDDNAVSRRILEAMLKRWLMKPVLAESGRTGLAALQAGRIAGTPFPLVLLDGQMPEMDGYSVAAEIQRDPGLAGSTVLMLTSTALREDVARCQTLGAAAYLMKPISETELLEAILKVLVEPSSGSELPRTITGHSLREDWGQLRVLLVEDVLINQVIASRMLQKDGHTVVIAGNGREALAALDEPTGGRFDLVLMDVQMPEMDGLEATALIREKEKSSGAHLPIIAMTAHAMKGDEKRCREAGMDGYLSKPFDPPKVFATIDSVLRARALETQS